MCKLVKALYGSKQAPRPWYDKLKTALLRKGFVNSTVDSSLLLLKNHEVTVYILVYVDDILLTGTSSKFIQDLVVDLNEEFALKQLGELSYFLGLESHKTEKELMLCQTKYALNLLEKTRMGEAHPCSTPMVVGTKLYGGDNDLFENPFLYGSTVRAL